jgi:Ca2+-binding EF-hand superfamily protein
MRGIASTPFRVFGIAAIVLSGLTTAGLASQPETAASPGSAPGQVSAPAGKPAETPTEDLVFLGGEHPVFVRLFAYVDGREVRVTRAERVAKTLAELDTNRDGVIDQAERTAHPRALRTLGAPEKWINLLPLIDKQPQDEKISSEELAVFYNERLGDVVTLAGQVRRGNQAVELFDLVDVDRDQRLTEDELKTLPARLHKLDADGDDAFSVVEVEPFRNPFGGMAPAAVVNEVQWATKTTVAERLLKRFDTAPKDGSLSSKELGQSDQSIGAADMDKNGGLSLAELQKWLPTVSPHFALTTNSFRKKAGRTELTWVDFNPGDDEAAKPKRQTAKNLEVKIADEPFQLEMRSPDRRSDQDNISFYRNQFRRADADKNKYLDKTEYMMLATLGAPFEVVDADDNAQIYEPELVEYLMLYSASEEIRIVLTFDRNEKSLFSLLDRNSDRRLSPRESMTTFDRWQAFDRDEDHVLTRSELTGKMRMMVELPKPKLLQSNNFQNGAMSGDPIIKAQTDGPVWFQGMDRNRDGDVSHREFLGTAAQFRKWDRDSDGLISKVEAIQ